MLPVVCRAIYVERDGLTSQREREGDIPKKVVSISRIIAHMPFRISIITKGPPPVFPKIAFSTFNDMQHISKMNIILYSTLLCIP